MPATRKPLILSLLILMLASQNLAANGILRNGNSAEAAATGGMDTASAGQPIDAMSGNPAGLSLEVDDRLQLGLTSAVLDVEFTNAANPRGADADSNPLPIPDLAYAHRVGPVTFGLGLNPVALSEADWRYNDTPTSADYGFTKHRSKFIAVRGSIGFAAEVSPGIHFGSSFGIIYNENTLQAPYIFQNQPALQDVKTRLDMKTDGIGYNATFGLLLEPRPDLRLGLRYTTATSIDSEGTASGSAALATGGAVGNYRFDADVETSLPAVASIGAEWRATPRWQLRGQLDWINWSDAFDTLPVRLTNGTNTTLNSIVGSDSLIDRTPLNWKDRLVARIGASYQWSDKTILRAGYSYGESPVPSATLTPLTGAIMEHTVGLGLGHQMGDYQIDVAYQWDLPTEQRVGNSALRAGEYSNSELDVGIHWLTLSVSLADPF